MQRLVIHTDKVPAARVPLSQAIKTGDWIFASGQLGMDPKTGRLAEGGIKTETRQVCENLKAVLAAAGVSKVAIASRSQQNLDAAKAELAKEGIDVLALRA